MKPYYSDEMVTLYQGDCLEVMPQLPDAGIPSVAMMFCDLPYEMTNLKWDKALDLPTFWQRVASVRRPKTAMCFTASQPFTSELVMSNRPWYRHEWIWRKNRASNFLNANKQPLKAHESVLIFAELPPAFYPQKTGGHQPANKVSRKAHGSGKIYRPGIESIYHGGMEERYPTSVIEVKCLDNCSVERVHPTQKPVGLVEYFVRTYTQPGETVLDPCAGSGTTALACRNAGRKCVLIELDERYCELAAKRLEQEVMALP